MDPSVQPNPEVPTTPTPEAPAPAAPVAPVAPVAPTPVAPVGENPGKGLGIASLILSIVGVHLIGLILGILGLNKSKKAGQKNGLALAGTIIGAIGLVFGIIITIVLIATSAALLSKCADLGPGEHYVDGVTYTCN